MDSDFDRWEALLTLITNTFAYMNPLIDPPSSAVEMTIRTLRQKAETETAVVAFIDTAVVGCLFLADRGDHFYLGKFAIARDYQGRGIGRALLARAEAIARSVGKPVIELQTRIELKDNHQTFERLGFRKTAETSHPGFDRITSITMRKDLGHGA
nr:GNAT family N-acetyltransferase [Phyllobacterium myrsinacearum]